MPSCNCPITGTLSVPFTGSVTPPASGYKIGWKVSGSTDAFTYVSNVFTSPATLTNIPLCQDIQVEMSTVCNNGQSSTPQYSTVTGYTNYGCASTITGTHTHNGAYTYPFYVINVTSATSTVTLSYDVQNYPNKFTVYDDTNTLVATTGWRGVAGFSGSWGASLSTPTTGTLSFTKNTGSCFYKLVVESETNSSVADTFTVGVSCPTVTILTPTITPVSCSSGAGVYQITGTAGTILKISLTATGTLTNNSSSGYCARFDASLTSSTGPTNSASSSVVSTSSSFTVGASDSLFITVTIPSGGTLNISTLLKSINSLTTGMTATLKIFEMNGSAVNITQTGLCILSTADVVSCGGGITYTNYYAYVYDCSTCALAQLSPVIVALPVSHTPIYNNYYIPVSGNSVYGTYSTVIFKLDSATVDSPGMIIETSNSISCSGACALMSALP